MITSDVRQLVGKDSRIQVETQKRGYMVDAYQTTGGFVEIDNIDELNISRFVDDESLIFCFYGSILVLVATKETFLKNLEVSHYKRAYFFRHKFPSGALPENSEFIHFDSYNGKVTDASSIYLSPDQVKEFLGVSDSELNILNRVGWLIPIELTRDGSSESEPMYISKVVKELSEHSQFKYFKSQK